MDIKKGKLDFSKLISPRYRGLLSLLLAAVVLVGGYFFILAQPINTYRDSLGLLSQQQADIKIAQAQIASAQAYSANLYNVTAEDKRVLDMALPTEPDFSSIIEQVTSLAERSGFTVSSIDVSEVNGKENVKSADGDIGKVSLKVKLIGGDYAQLKRFVELSEKSVMVMDITSLNFSSKEPTYDVSLLVYYYLKG
jgi:Tfp pilus assembly protein PilO